MRIITGTAKGRRLTKLQSTIIRPTSDKVKGSLFNILGNDILKSSFADLFCGTGNIGLEAFSRGAGTVYFVDDSMASKKITFENIGLCGYTPFINNQIFFYFLDAFLAIKNFSRKKQKVDFIFLDPPYRKKMVYEKALTAIEKYSILHREGMIIAEHCKWNLLADQYGTLKRVKVRSLGDTALSFYHIAP